MHRGPKVGAVVKAKSVKQSTRRANEIFNSGSASNTVLPHLPNRLPASEGQGVAPQSQHIIAWVSQVFLFASGCLPELTIASLCGQAKAFSSAHPYVSSEERAAAGKARLERMRAERQQVCSVFSALSSGRRADVSISSLRFPPLRAHLITPTRGSIISSPRCQ